MIAKKHVQSLPFAILQSVHINMTINNPASIKDNIATGPRVGGAAATSVNSKPGGPCVGENCRVTSSTSWNKTLDSKGPLCHLCAKYRKEGKGKVKELRRHENLAVIKIRSGEDIGPAVRPTFSGRTHMLICHTDGAFVCEDDYRPNA